MARDFNGTSQYLTVADTPYGSLPVGGFSFGCWVNMDSGSSGGQVAMMLGDTNTSQWTGWYIDCNVGNGDARAINTLNNSFAGISTATGFTAGTWHHVGAYMADTTAVTVYLNGIAGSTAASGASPTGVDTTRIAAGTTTTPALADGKICESWIASGALSAYDWMMLGKGYAPDAIIGDARLVRYWPVHGSQSPEPEIVGGMSMTLVGAPPASPHFSVVRPHMASVVHIETAAPPAAAVPAVVASRQRVVRHVA